MMIKALKAIVGWFFPLGIVFVAGCNPAATAIKIGVHLVGQVVADERTNTLGRELIGRGPASADAKLGDRSDAWRDVNAPREWLVYPAKVDILGNRKYVVEVHRNRIVSVMMVDKGGRKMDLVRNLYYQEKLKGKTPSECRAILNMGTALLTVRSEKTGQVGQLYDVRRIEGMGPTRYCAVKFDSNQRCYEANLVEVSASTGNH